MNTNLVEKLATEIKEMTELVNDKEATFEMRCNARNYIRGMKFVIRLLEEDK